MLRPALRQSVAVNVFQFLNGFYSLAHQSAGARVTWRVLSDMLGAFPFILQIIVLFRGSLFMRRFTSSGSCLSLILIAAASLIGCEDVATTPPGAPIVQPAADPSTPPVVQTIKPQAPAQPQPSAELEDPRAIISKFLNTPTTERKDTDIMRVCNLSSGNDDFKDMDLNSSSVTDEGIKHLAKLKNLETLNLTSTKITGVGFAATLELPKLRSVNLTNCNVTPAILETLSKLESLEELALERTNVGDNDLAALENLANLKSLNLSYTQISDMSFKSLNKITGLELLKIGNTGVQGQGMQFMKRKKGEPGLRVLDAQHSRFGLFGLQHLKNLETLEELDVSQAEVSNATFQGIKGNVHLKKLNLGFNQINDAGLAALGTLRGLEEISLRNISMVSDVTLGNLSKCKDLRVADINGTTCSLNGVARLKKILPNCAIKFMGTDQ